MTIYIIDSNIVFSAALHPGRSIGRFLFTAENYGIQLLAPEFLKSELARHFNRLLELTELTPEQLRHGLNLFFSKISFIEDKLIPMADFAEASRLIREVDEMDIPFVALSIRENELLLTGDLKLFEGLLSKGYTKVITFQQLKEIHNIP